MAGRKHPSDIQDARLLAVLDRYVPPIIGRSIVERARREAISGPDVSWTDPNGLLDRISVGVRLFAAPDQQAAILREITDLAVAEREDPPVSYRFEGPPSSRKPSSSSAATTATHSSSSPARVREEPPTRREPALGPPPSSGAPKANVWPVGSTTQAPGSPPQGAGWTAGLPSTSQTAAPSASPLPQPANWPAGSTTTTTSAPTSGGGTWNVGSTAAPGAGHDPSPPASRRDQDIGSLARRATDGSSVTRGVFPTTQARPSSPGAGASGGGRVQVVRGAGAPPPPPAGPSRTTSGTPPTGMPRVPPTAREGGPAGPPQRTHAGGVMPRAPGRIEITHAVPKAPPVPSRIDIISMPREKQSPENTPREVTITLSTEHDIPLARQVAREICERLGTRALTQQRLLTIVSELGRNMVLYAGGGRMTLRPPTAKSRRIVVIAVDQGPGIPNLSEIMAGKYKSRSGLGLGLLGTKRLADSFNVDTGRAGTTVSVEVIL